MSDRSDLIDILVKLHVSTEKAVRVSDDGEEKSAVWLPRSQIEIEPDKNGLYMLTLPEWLAKEKGFI